MARGKQDLQNREKGTSPPRLPYRPFPPLVDCKEISVEIASSPDIRSRATVRVRTQHCRHGYSVTPSYLFADFLDFLPPWSAWSSAPVLPHGNAFVFLVGRIVLL